MSSTAETYLYQLTGNGSLRTEPPVQSCVAKCELHSLRDFLWIGSLSGCTAQSVSPSFRRRIIWTRGQELFLFLLRVSRNEPWQLSACPRSAPCLRESH